jgi:histone demethylase JARID1
MSADTRNNLNYLDQLSKFHMARNGTNLNRFPSVDKRPLDLYKLKKFVEDKGGFDAVCRQKRWAEIGRDLGYSGKIMSSLSTSLKNSYQKWLQPYEDWLRYNKPSILQQQEIENGGPYTPSPAATPAKSQHQTPNIGPVSPTLRASSALNAALHAAAPQPAVHGSPTPAAPVETPQPPPPTNGFTPVNVGGFTAVNARPLQPPTSTHTPQAPPPAGPLAPSSHPSPFTTVNGTNGILRPETAQSTPARSEMSPLTSMENTPDVPHMAQVRMMGGPPPAPFPYQVPNNNGLIHGLKRLIHEDELNGDENGRAKRIKTESIPTVAGSGMVQPRLPAPRLHLPRDRSQDKPGDLCEECGRGDDETAILICDHCDSGYHQYCLRPPLKSIPEQDWFCPRCLFGRGEYGFEEGAVYSLKQFQEKAHEFKMKHFQGKATLDPQTGLRRPPAEEDVEKEFWRLTESLTETVEVEYGADIHSTTHGSAFPTLELQATDPYAVDSWNLNVLPLDKESLFRHIKTDISGMTVPWLYVGMCFSTFCWHSEDHYAYSINYQHFGETKTWYGIPGEDAEKFEAAMREKIPEMFEQQPDLLFQLVTLLQPEKLQKAGVRVYALDQRAGQFVITFPQAYHAGFNHGFNFNEAVNFAPADWEPFGGSSIVRLQDYRRQPVFCHEELLMSAASRDHSIKTAKWLGPALQRMLDREMKMRQEFSLEYGKAKHPTAEDGADDDSVIGHDSEFPFEKDEKDYVDDDIVCTYCKAYCYLSRYVCKKSNRIVCLLHAGKFECCENTSPEDRTSLKDDLHYVQLRQTDEELSIAVQKVVDVSRTPEIWNEKLDKMLEDGPRAQLKTLRSLVSEGERINQHWDLPQLPELRKYVERCNEWVEEATNYITRKQQNRRKNERAWRKNSTRSAEAEEREKELRNVDKIKKLLEQAEDLSFECPELETLQDRADKIDDFRKRAAQAVRKDNITTAELEELIEESKTFGVDMPEIEVLETRARRTKWYERANEAYEKFAKSTPLSLQEVEEFIKEGREVGLPERDEHLKYFMLQQEQGTFWEQKVKELMAAEPINYAQLDTLARQATIVPVSKETLAQIDAILAKQREAQEKINNLYQRCKDPDFRKRPKYQEVREAMESLTELNNKPPGTMDLEREQKRHEDWMRRGKKLFGKANAPLHILLQHMKIVEERNEHCLDPNDEPRLPVEPSSRANSPAAEDDGGIAGTGREVFCICRKPEAGMMIECEMCHEW